MKNIIWTALLLVSLSSQAQIARPPQFVMLAFDNCQENQSWEQVTQFLQQMNSVNQNKLRFTFFLSAVGLLTNSAKNNYLDPKGASGVSNINFGGSSQDVLKRIAYINQLHSTGNEIASHAVGHFNGAAWTEQMWRHEFQQYNQIVDNVADINGFEGEQKKLAQLKVSSRDLTGFRAPYLEGGTALLKILKEFGFKYDTSNTDQGWEANTWPRRYQVDGKASLWNFGLSFLPFGSGKIPAMDYNFCYRQDKECQEKYPDSLKTAQADADVMLNLYLDQFIANYNKNRAPLHIGHHFQAYRGGVYNQALFRFAKIVCGLPEVRCTTYKELTKFMDALGPKDREQYQKAEFYKLPPIKKEQLLNGN